MNQREREKLVDRTFSNGNLCISGTSMVNSESSRKNCYSRVDLSPPIRRTVEIDKKPFNLSHANNLSNSECSEMTPCGTIIIRTIAEGQIEAWRIEKERERNPDRFSLDKRSLTTLPILLNESKLRLLSLQHNLLTKLEQVSLECLSQLVFLDVYNNQLESMASLNCLKNLRVLLLGKNRIKFIESLDNVTKLEVLDLHGNQIVEVGGLTSQKELKVLNLAGNEIKAIGSNDLKGLCSLQELNIRRNRIKQVLGFHETPQLIKLFLSNNEITSIDRMDSLKYLSNLKEIGLEGNPVCSLNECTLFIVSCLPAICFIDRVPVTDDIVKMAGEWKIKERDKRSSATISTTNMDDIQKKPSEKFDYSVRLKSASQSNSGLSKFVTESRTVRPPVKSSSSSSTPSFGKELERKFPRNAVKSASGGLRSISQLAKLRRTRFFKGRTTENGGNNESNESESARDDFFRLPPILSPLLRRLNDGGNHDDHRRDNYERTVVKTSSSGGDMLNNNTSMDSNKTCRSVITMAAADRRSDENLFNNYSPSSSAPSSFCCSSADEDNEDGANFVLEKKKLLDDSRLICETERCYSTDENYKQSPMLDVAATSVSGKQTTIIATPPSVKSKYRTRLKKCQRVEKVLERGGDYVVEIAGRYLNVSGKNSWKFIDRAWNVDKASDVCTVRFNSVGFDSLIPSLNKLKFRFPNAEHFVFTDTNITGLGQLNALADIQGLTSLHIIPDGNPIALKNWQNYAIFRLHHWGLRYVDNIAITEEQIAFACEEYKGLGDVVLYSLPDCLLTPLLSKLRLEVKDVSPKQWLYKADATLRDVICKEALQWRSQASLTQTDECLREKGRTHLTDMVTRICSSVDKLNTLERTWPLIMRRLIRDTLIDFAAMETYVKTKMQDLNL